MYGRIAVRISLVGRNNGGICKTLSLDGFEVLVDEVKPSS